MKIQTPSTLKKHIGLGLPESLALQYHTVSSWRYLIAKRCIDVVVSLIGIFFLSPLLVLISVLIKIDSSGPALYKQLRLQQKSRPFLIFKFRTMPHNIEKDIGPVWAKVDDPRSTRIGKYLRRWHLDELPQLFNVIKGEMSLVGPRPERPFFVNQFTKSIPYYQWRHIAKPGLTGWAQVNGLCGDTSVQERTHCDLFYIQHWSLVFDLKILLKTCACQQKQPTFCYLTFSQNASCFVNNPIRIPTPNA